MKIYTLSWPSEVISLGGFSWKREEETRRWWWLVGPAIAFNHITLFSEEENKNQDNWRASPDRDAADGFIGADWGRAAALGHFPQKSTPFHTGSLVIWPKKQKQNWGELRNKVTFQRPLSATISLTRSSHFLSSLSPSSFTGITDKSLQLPSSSSFTHAMFLMGWWPVSHQHAQYIAQSVKEGGEWSKEIRTHGHVKGKWEGG